jgi:hypothetical protein
VRPHTTFTGASPSGSALLAVPVTTIRDRKNCACPDRLFMVTNNLRGGNEKKNLFSVAKTTGEKHSIKYKARLDVQYIAIRPYRCVNNTKTILQYRAFSRLSTRLVLKYITDNLNCYVFGFLKRNYVGSMKMAHSDEIISYTG